MRVGGGELKYESGKEFRLFVVFAYIYIYIFIYICPTVHLLGGATNANRYIYTHNRTHSLSSLTHTGDSRSWLPGPRPLAAVVLVAVVLSPSPPVVLEQGPTVNYMSSQGKGELVQDLAVMSADLSTAVMDEQKLEAGMSPGQQLKMRQLQRLHAVPNGLLDIQPDSVLNIDSSDAAVWGPGGDPFKNLEKLKPRFSRAVKRPKSHNKYWEGHFGGESCIYACL